MAIAEILGGAFLLVLGRKLFWMYVAIMGFVYGFTIASERFTAQPEWQKIAIGIFFGILFALLAISFQQIAIILAGFSGGAAILIGLFGLLFKQVDISPSHIPFWILLLMGGVVGAVLAYRFFDWALIILSSSYGAFFILTGFNLDMSQNWPIALGLIILGIIAQAGIKKKLPDRKKEIKAEAH